MSRPVRRRRTLSIALAAGTLLIAPAAASAATYTVSPGGGACGGADTTCGGLDSAAAAAAAGDVFNLTPGIYVGGNFAVGGVTINGAPGVLVNSTVQFSGASGGVSKMSKVAVVQAASTGTGVLVTGASGLELSDGVVISANDDGIHISEGTANKILRTVVATGGAQASAIRVQSGPGAAKQLLVESTLTSGGAHGIGAFSKAAGLSSAGAITLTMHHVTAAGSTNGIVVDSSQGVAGLTSGGSIAATLTDSIAFPNVVKNQPGLLGIAANTATLTVDARTLVSGDKAAIFADAAGGNYRLRPGSPAIGQGSVTAGESATDIDGDDRSAPPTDLGGDEYVNAPPVAKIAVANKTPRAGQQVVFDGTGSSDREAAYGGGIVQYQWLYSDGKGETTTGPAVAHTFDKEGAAAAQLTVVDRQGVASAPVTVTFQLLDGTPPTVAIVKPKNNQKISRYITKKTTRTVNGKKKTTSKRTRRKIVFGGLSRDANGVAQIALTLEKTGSLPKSKSKTKAKASAATSKRCIFYDPKRGNVRRSCGKPILFLARLVKDSKTGEWTYTVGRNLSKGRYKLTAVGIDKSGSSGNSGGTKLGVVKFTLT